MDQDPPPARPAKAAPVLADVLRFTAARWARRPALVALCAGAMLAATVTEVLVPVQAGRLVEAVAAGARAPAWAAFDRVVALGAAMVVLRYLGWRAIIPLTLGLMAEVAADAFARVQRLSSEWHASTLAGSTVRQVTRGMWALDTLDDVLLLSLLPSAAVLAGTVGLLSARAPLLGAVMGVGALAYVATTVGLATRVLAPIAQRSNRADTRVGGVLADAVGNNAVVKAFGAEEREEARLAAAIGDWLRLTDRTWQAFTWSGTGQSVILWLVRAAVTGAALWLWTQGRADAGDLAFVLTSYLVLHGYLRDIGQHVQTLQRSANELEELVALCGEAPAVADRPGAPPLLAGAGAIRFERVWFGYRPGLPPLFQGLDVTIPAGQRVGLVGRSGSGKTSFVKLIQRLYDPTAGRVLIDGQDVGGVAQASLRRAIAIVPQEPVLFHRTLAENIAYARPDATAAEIAEAARLANAAGFIARLPEGFATPVGERGVKLSGGERQRIAIARAFLADAPILILDEATSSLDAESEEAIAQAMERLMAGRTTLVVAHRLATVRALDRILVFDRGRVVEDGTHASLLAAPDGTYRRLFEHQAGGPAAEIVGG